MSSESQGGGSGEENDQRPGVLTTSSVSASRIVGPAHSISTALPLEEWRSTYAPVAGEISVDPENREIFVGYPYELPKDDYRGVFAAIGDEYDVTFIFADEELTNKHILDKIASMMTRAAFSLFDITLWNPNVALELGIAYGGELDFYILFDPTKGEADVLTDVRGIDRIQYRSLHELTERLQQLMRDQFGAPEDETKGDARDLVAQVHALSEEVIKSLTQTQGQTMGGIASSLGVPIELAQYVVRPMVGAQLETRGLRRGTRYYVGGMAPPEDAEEEPSSPAAEE